MNRRSTSSDDDDDDGCSAARSDSSQDVSEKRIATSTSNTGTVTSLKAGSTSTAEAASAEAAATASASRSSIRTPLETHLSTIMSGSEFRNLKLVPDNARMPARSFHSQMLRDLMDVDQDSTERGDARATTDRLVKSLSDQSLHGHARADRLLRLQSTPTRLSKGETRWQSHEPLMSLSSSAVLSKASATSSIASFSSPSSLTSNTATTKRTSRSSNFARYKRTSSSALHRSFPLGTNPRHQQRPPYDFSFLDDHSETSGSQTSRTSSTIASTVVASNATQTLSPGKIKEAPDSKNVSTLPTTRRMSTSSRTVRNPLFASSSLSARGSELPPPLAVARWSSDSTIFSLSPGETNVRRRTTTSTGGVATAAGSVPRSTQSFPLTTRFNTDTDPPLRPSSRQQVGPPRPPSRYKSSGSWSSNDGECLEEDDEDDVNTTSSSNERTSSSGDGDDEGSSSTNSSSCDATIETDK